MAFIPFDDQFPKEQGVYINKRGEKRTLFYLWDDRTTWGDLTVWMFGHGFPYSLPDMDGAWRGPLPVEVIQIFEP